VRIWRVKPPEEEDDPDEDEEERERWKGWSAGVVGDFTEHR